VKRFYRRVKKGQHTIGIGLQVRRERLIQRIKERNQRRTVENDNLPSLPFEVTETLPPTALTDHYQISMDTRNKVELRQWLKKNESDPAIHVSTSDFPSEIFSYCILGISPSTQKPSSVSSAWAQV